VDLDVLLECFTRLEERLAFCEGFAADTTGEHLKNLVHFLMPLREIHTKEDEYQSGAYCPLLSAKDGRAPPNSPSRMYETPNSEPAEANCP
ncbi:hypothetical protein GP486_001617, partial [Trichoglossum hirsutum]